MSSSQVRRNGPYAPLGANYADDDAIATLDLEENDRAELLYLRGLAYCARDPRTEGYISDVALRTAKVLRRKHGRKNVDTVIQSATRLEQLGLWTREGDGYRITSWLKWNKSWSEISRSRAQDRARKGGTDEEADGNDSGSHADSGRKPSGVRAPRHGTAVHGTSRHGTADQGSSTPPPAAGPGDQRGGSTEPTLLDQHQTEYGPLPPPTRTALNKHIADCLVAGLTEQHVLAGLAEWRRRPQSKPGLLPHLVADAARTDPDPGHMTPEIREWIERETAKRAAAAEAASA